MRNKANFVHILHFKNSSSIDDVIRFPFDKIMIEKKIFNKNNPSAQMIKQMKRFEIRINQCGH